MNNCGRCASIKPDAKPRYKSVFTGIRMRPSLKIDIGYGVSSYWKHSHNCVKETTVCVTQTVVSFCNQDQSMEEHGSGFYCNLLCFNRACARPLRHGFCLVSFLEYDIAKAFVVPFMLRFISNFICHVTGDHVFCWYNHTWWQAY